MAARWQAFPLWHHGQQLPQGGSVWNQLQALQSEMNRVFDRWGTDGGRALAVAYPPVNLWEDADSLYIETELPGLSQKDLALYVTGGNQFTIKGERKEESPGKGVWHRQERPVGSFTRVLTLPYEVDRDKVDARFENGVLQVKLAKHESAKPRRIVVKGE
jgi:HSP20 family protein